MKNRCKSTRNMLYNILFSATFCFDLTYFCNILLFQREFYKRSHFFLAKILSEGENE